MRFLSFLLMVFGIWLFFSPISIIIGYIPLLGGVLSGILSFAILLAAILVSIPMYVITLGISWACFNPKIGIAFLSAGVLLLVIIIAIFGGRDSTN